MTKTPDEIKKGLECCWGSRAETGLVGCDQCPYWGKYGCPAGKVKLGNDALVLIRQLQGENAEQAEKIRALEARVQQLEAERDAAVVALKGNCVCPECKYFSDDIQDPCRGCKPTDSKFEWRGVQKD